MTVRVAWPPGSRKGCGHAPCRRYTIASSAALLVADGGLVGIGATPAGMAHPRPLVAAACVIAAAGIVLALWPHARGGTGTGGSGDDVIGLVDMAREDIPDHVPDEWTRENS